MTATPGAPVPECVAVVGGGRMGSGIAHAFLLAGARVVVVESDTERARGAGERVAAAVRATAARSLLAQVPGEVLTRLLTTTDMTAVRDAGLAVEAVPEVPALKREVLARLDRVLDAGAILATNTSSIGIGSLGTALSPDRAFLGLHFFNPVPASSLIEVVRGPSTPDDLVERACGWAHRLDKTPVVVRDSPGFATSRLGVALGLEAIRMLEEDVASAQDIDAAMVLGYRHATGPLRLTDLVGLDVRLSIADELHRRLGPRFAPPALLRAKVAAGETGKKAGCGFYTW